MKATEIRGCLYESCTVTVGCVWC